MLNCFFANCFLYRKKDGVDIDNFIEYKKLVKKILDEEPSKMIVYLDLDDVKANARVHSIFYIYDAYSIFQQCDNEDSASNKSAGEEDSDVSSTKLLLLVQAEYRIE